MKFFELIGWKNDSETILRVYAEIECGNEEVKVYEQTFYKAARTYSKMTYTTSFSFYKGYSGLEMAKLHAEWGRGCTLVK